MRRTMAAIAAVALMLLAGCGSAETKAPAGAAKQGQGPSETPITVGFICSCTGPLAKSIGRSEEVIQAWAKYTNANGGLNGHPVKVITADDGQNPAQALKAVKKLVEQDKVMAIVGQ